MQNNQEEPELKPVETEKVEESSPADADLAGEDQESQQEPAWQSLVEEVADREAKGNQREPETDPVVQLVHEYKDAIKARDEWQDKYLRAAAEYANAKRRAELRADNDIFAARERLLTNILPVLDDFERALAAIPADEHSPWEEGFALIQRKLQGVLEREGVTEIPAAEGEPFDPNLHQAVLTEEVEGAESGRVLDVFQKGYSLNDRILRPAMVKVAR